MTPPDLDIDRLTLGQADLDDDGDPAFGLVLGLILSGLLWFTIGWVVFRWWLA